MNELDYNIISTILTDLTLLQKQIISRKNKSFFELKEIKLPERLQETENIV